MALLPILQFPDPRLRRPCLPIGKIDDGVRQLAADMLETMYAAEGRGLAAPQVGVLRRLFVMDVAWKEAKATPLVCLDPVIIAASEAEATFTEGCLSIPGVPATIRRPAEITLEWTALSGQRHRADLTGIAAICAQHELDHLNGRLCIDLLDEAARTAVSPALAALGGDAIAPLAKE